MVTSKLPQASSSSSSGKQLKKPFSKLFCLWRKTNINLPRERLGLYRRFTFKEVQAATGNFRFKIASGGYSDVFRGCIGNGDDEYPVAFRRFNKSERRRYEEEFLTEMGSLLNLHHPHINIIPLIGYCLDGPDRFSVYEYMPRGTLYDQLHSMNDSHSLPWKLRLQICIGVARGLECLLTGNPVIIHRDIKSSNILLNQNWVPKISGFGLSISMPTTSLSEEPDSHVSVEIAGTVGYLDPESLPYCRVTTKSDVYSFGVVLFEVLSGRKPWDIARTETQLIQWARQCVEVKRLDEMIDPRLEGRDKIAVAPACLKAYANLAYDCTNERGNGRPSIAAVVKRLQLVLLLQECFEAHVPFSPSWLHSIPDRGRGHPFDFEETQDSVSTGPPSDRSEPLVEMEIADLGSPNLEFTDSDYEILGRGR